MIFIWHKQVKVQGRQRQKPVKSSNCCLAGSTTVVPCVSAINCQSPLKSHICLGMSDLNFIFCRDAPLYFRQLILMSTFNNAISSCNDFENVFIWCSSLSDCNKLWLLTHLRVSCIWISPRQAYSEGRQLKHSIITELLGMSPSWSAPATCHSRRATLCTVKSSSVRCAVEPMRHWADTASPSISGESWWLKCPGTGSWCAFSQNGTALFAHCLLCGDGL